MTKTVELVSNAKMETVDADTDLGTEMGGARLDVNDADVMKMPNTNDSVAGNDMNDEESGDKSVQEETHLMMTGARKAPTMMDANGGQPDAMTAMRITAVLTVAPVTAAAKTVIVTRVEKHVDDATTVDANRGETGMNGEIGEIGVDDVSAMNVTSGEGERVGVTSGTWNCPRLHRPRECQ